MTCIELVSLISDLEIERNLKMEGCEITGTHIYCIHTSPLVKISDHQNLSGVMAFSRQ